MMMIVGNGHWPKGNNIFVITRVWLCTPNPLTPPRWEPLSCAEVIKRCCKAMWKPYEWVMMSYLCVT